MQPQFNGACVGVTSKGIIKCATAYSHHLCLSATRRNAKPAARKPYECLSGPPYSVFLTRCLGVLGTWSQSGQLA